MSCRIIAAVQETYNINNMPHVHKGSLQKNRKFKGSTKSAKKTARLVQSSSKALRVAKTKPITKSLSQPKSKVRKAHKMHTMRKSADELCQRLTAPNKYLDAATKQVITGQLKQQSEIKVVLLLPCNSDADAEAVARAINDALDEQNFLVKSELNACRSYLSLQIYPRSNKTFLKNRIHILVPRKGVDQAVDLAKCADIICPILSCRSANPQGINLDPHAEAKAFDDTGYAVLNVLRRLGLPSVIGLVQHLDTHQSRHRDKISKLFKRFLTSELGDEEKTIGLETETDVEKLLRVIDNITVQHPPWKSQRGFMLIDNIVAESAELVTVEGYLKGNCVHSNQLLHLTGFDDYEIEKIEIKMDHGKTKRHAKGQMTEEDEQTLKQYAIVSDQMERFAKPEAVHEDLLTALQALHLGQEQEMQGEGESGESEDPICVSDKSIESDQCESEVDEQLYFGGKAQEKKKRVQLQMRKQDELQFEDEVEYAADEQLRDKYRDYQGLKNFKTSDWNHLENLPEEYDRIFTFRNYHKTLAAVLKENVERGFAYNGLYIAVTFKLHSPSFLSSLASHLDKFPLIGSFLLKHQRKMTVLHTKLRRNPFDPSGEIPVESNKSYLLSLGFRKLTITPIFSRCLNGCDKTKYVREIGDDYENYFYCSFYGSNYFPPAPALLYDLHRSEASPLMVGELAKCDSMHIVLERILLTGYPFKINRRRSTIRFMFFNPKDVKFFKPIELRTKLGLRGRIEDSLGTHGLMKCLFSDKIKHNDTVYMTLYRRVFPKWPY